MSRHKELANNLEEYAQYLELDGQDGRAVAYERAARELRKNGYLPPDPSQIDGIGDSIRQKIAVYQRSGDIPEFEELREEYRWFEQLNKVDGIGPARAREIHHKFRVQTLDDLILVGEDLEILSGVGKKRRKKIMDSAREVRQNDQS